MKKTIFRSITLILIILSIITILFSCTNKNSEIIKNGQFSASSDTETTVIKDWQAYNAKVDKDQIIKRIKHSETILFSSNKEQTAYLYQEVELKKGFYEIEANFNIDKSFNNFEKNGEEKTPGLSIGFLNKDDNVSGIKASGKTRDFETRKQAIEVENDGIYKFVVGIGANKITGKAKGEAEVKTVKVTRISKAQATSLGIDQTKVGKGYDSSVYKKNLGSTVLITLASIFSLILFIVFGVILAKKVRKPSEKELTNFVEKEKKSFKLQTHKERFNSIVSSNSFIIVLIMLFAFAIRFTIIATMPVLYENLIQYIKVASGMADKGIFVAYSDLSSTLEFGYLYLFYFIGLFAKAIKLGSTTFGYSMLLRLPDLIAELIICYILFSILLEKTSRKRAVFGSLIYALVPAFFVFSALNVRLTSIGILFAILMILSLSKGKYNMVPIYLFAGSMFEYSLVLFTSMILVALIIALSKDKSKDLKINVLLTFLISMVIYILLALPFDYEFIKKGKILYFLTIIGKNLTQNKLLSPSTFNLYGLFGLSRAESPLSLVILTGILLTLLYGFFAKAYYTDQSKDNLMLFAGYSFVATGIIGAMVTPLFMSIGIVLLLFYSLIKRERRVYSAMSAIGTLYTINELYIYLISGTSTKNSSGKVLINAHDALYMFSSFLILVAFIYLSYVAYTIIFKNKEYYFDDIIFQKKYILKRKIEIKEDIISFFQNKIFKKQKVKNSKKRK